MVDSMKFGPEWLRNMKSGDSSGGIGNNVVAPLSAPIKMAEFRYGREEMLALFDRTILPPDPLKQMQGLYVKDTQLPLALIQMTEDETRMWNRGINSDAALRLSMHGVAGQGPGGQRGGMGGRGGSVDRGRGRARGSYHYSRGLSYDDSENTNGYIRGRNSYDRSQSGGGWGERNGGDTGDSPRKEFGSRSQSDTNWRRHRASGGEDDDGWRASRPSDKWGRGNSNSWREGEGWERGSRPWEETNNTHPPPRKPWENEENNLPEWAMENPSESGGSFDASGAFHGGTVYSDEEESNNGTNHQKGGPARADPSKSNTSQPRPAPQNKKEPPNITNGMTSSHESGAGDRDNSNVAPLRQSHSASALVSGERRPPSLPHPISTSASFSGVNSHPSVSAVESKPQREQPIKATSSLEQRSSFTNYVPPKPAEEPKPPQKPSHEDEIEQRLLNDADVFVSRLMDEEDGEPIPSPSNPSPSHHHPNAQSPPIPNSDIRWVYQDPQGEIQGNFSAIEMTEWYNMGYFKPSLLVRRTGDDVFLPISEMKRFWKADKPFEVDYNTLPPIKKNQPALVPQTLPQAVPPTPAMDESLMLQYQLHQQLLQQRQQAIFARLSQSEQFNSLSALEQRQVVNHHVGLAGMETLQGGLILPHLQQHAANPPTNSNVIAVLQMLAAQQQQQQQQQLQQQQQRLGGGSVPVQVGLPPAAEPPLDPLQQIMSQIGLQGATRPPAPATPQNTPEDQRSFDQFLNSFRQRQASTVQAQPQPQPQPQPPLQPQSVVMESVWGGPTTAPAFPGWSVPPGHPPASVPSQSLWEPIAKGIKTEADILEEQLRAEEKKKEELRKQEELLRLKQEEEERERLRRLKEEEELERKRQEEEERGRERERKRLQEAEEKKKKEAAAAKKAEQDRLRKEEEKKRKEEEKRRKEEEKRKLEEEKKKAEEEKRRQEEEKKKQEEMAKRQNEALKCMQEQQQAQARAVKAATTPAPWTPPEPTGPSLADIQKTERKQQLQQLREQQEMLRMFQEKHQHQQDKMQLKNSKSASGLNLKWAETPNPVPTRVKSLAEIQAEEQESLAKQAEKEKAERMAASKDVPVPATGSIWQSATQSLTWNNNSAPSVWGPMPVNSMSGGGARFFDEERNKPAAKPQAQAQAKPQAKTKAKKEEATVMKLFEKQIPQTAKTEELNKWCAKVFQDTNNIDIPTFVDFLWTVESQVDIQEYSLIYLDEPRRAANFAAEFMMRRQRLLSNNPQADLRQEPLPPPAQPSNNFQEVKGKNKKMKKKNMTKVDSRILGFNVTAAPDRINVGDRDYGENI